MAFSFHNLLHIILLLLVPILCSTITFASNFVNEICPKTRNPTVCFQVLKSNLNANLTGLAQTSIESATDSGLLAYDQINTLAIQTKDPVLVQRYSSCLKNYGRANSDVANSRKLLKSRDYRGVRVNTSSALAEATACDKNFDQPPSAPAQFKTATQYFQDVASVLSVISNRLAGN